MHALEQLHARALAGAGEGWERPFGGRDGVPGVLRVGQAHLPNHLFGGGVEQVEHLVAVRGDEGTVDINLVDDLHGGSPG
ncbi:hypothetical protein D3C85_1641250 [compost metagenome]